MTGRRPFESNSWLDLLEMQFSSRPPYPRSFDPDIPETVEAAILKALEKDPNLRFSTCTDLAVALGCQFLTGPAPLPRILLETEVKRMGGRWKTVLYPFALKRPGTHLALAPGALWAIHRTELMRWPLAQLHDVRRRGLRGLSFRIRGVTGKDRQWFRFKSRKDLRGWQESLGSLMAADQTAAAPGNNVAAAVETTLDPRVEPVVLLKGRPGTRFQLLSAVEAKGPNRLRAESGLAIRRAMLGADAVVDLNAERLPGFIRTEHRASGTAVRAVDEEGRLELKSRWFAGQIDKIKLPMLVLAFLTLLGASFVPLAAYVTLLTQPAPSKTSGSFAETLWNSAPFLAFAIVMTTVTVSMIVSRWPQLVRPTAVCFLAKAVQEGLTILAGLARLVSLGRSLFDATRGFADLGIPSSPGVGVSIVIGASSLLFLLWSFSFLFLKAADAEAVTRLYTDDGVLMAQESPPAVGSAAVRSAYVGLFQMIGLDITFHVAEVVELTPEWAFAHDFDRDDQGQRDRREIPEANQELFIFKKTESRTWQIARYSFSVINPPQKQ